LEFDHKAPGNPHAAGSGPLLPGEVSGKNIERCITLDGFKSTISRRIGVAGVHLCS
jgi:hypothetical protein